MLLSRYTVSETASNSQGGIIKAAFLGEILLVKISLNRGREGIFCSRKATKDRLLLSRFKKLPPQDN
jgi:hypothetical protein